MVIPLPANGNGGGASASVEQRSDGAFVVRFEVSRVDAPDELGTIERFANEFGLEPKGLKRAAVQADVHMVKVGRQWVARRSDVVGIVAKLAKKTNEKSSSEPDTYAALVARARGNAR